MKMIYIHIACAVLVVSTLASEPKITCEPRELHGLPGKPLRVELTVETDRVAPMQLRIPSVSNLVLCTVEKIPIRRTPEGHYIQKRIIIWQGVEAGSSTITNMTVVFQPLENVDAVSSPRFQGLKKTCPDIEITINEVTPAEPPPPSTGSNETRA